MNKELGNTSIPLPLCGLGTASIDPSIASDVVVEAVQRGYRHIDCAARYKNEASVGNGLKLVTKMKNFHRKDLFISSKLWCSDQHPSDVAPAFQKSVSDLQLEYLDLYMMHWPIRTVKHARGILEGENVIPYSKESVLETWREMEKLVDKNLCKYIGVSNFNICMLEELLQQARIKPSVNQVELHPYLPQHKLVKFCHENGILLIAFTPLGNVNRRSMYRNSTQPELLENEVLQSISQKYSTSPAQESLVKSLCGARTAHQITVALSWNFHRGVAVIPKSIQSDHLKENLDALNLKLDLDDISALNDIKTRCRYIDFTWCHKDGVEFWERDDK